MFCTSLRRRGVGATARGDAPTFSTSAAWPESADFGDEDGDEPGESTRERFADEGPSPEAEAEAEAGACGSFRHDQSSGFSRSDGGPNGLGVRAVGGGVFIANTRGGQRRCSAKTRGVQKLQTLETTKTIGSALRFFGVFPFMHLTLGVLALAAVPAVVGHGALVYPPGRNS
jgi:hypothetical protein